MTPQQISTIVRAVQKAFEPLTADEIIQLVMEPYLELRNS
jgi:hypothetical protein